MVLPYLDNIGVEILFLPSVALISNIGLLIEDALTGEPNEKDPTFNKEPSPDNDEFETILISGFCVFEKIMVYCWGILVKRRRYTWIPAHYSSPKNLKNIQVTHLIVGRLRITFPKLIVDALKLEVLSVICNGRVFPCTQT